MVEIKNQIDPLPEFLTLSQVAERWNKKYQSGANAGYVLACYGKLNFCVSNFERNRFSEYVNYSRDYHIAKLEECFKQSEISYLELFREIRDLPNFEKKMLRVRDIDLLEFESSFIQNNNNSANNQDDIKTDGETELKQKELKPLKKNKTESLQLIYKITTAYNVKYENDLTGISAWGLIVSGKFTNDLIKTKPANNHDVLVLNGGETLTQAEFIRKYRERFN